MSAERLRLCWDAVKGVHDPFRVVWDEQATNKDRRLMLAMAGEPPALAGRMAGRGWLDLSAELRGNIRAGMKRFAAWAERLQ
jgi:hypothetical protein